MTSAFKKRRFSGIIVLGDSELHKLVHRGSIFNEKKIISNKYIPIINKSIVKSNSKDNSSVESINNNKILDINIVNNKLITLKELSLRRPTSLEKNRSKINNQTQIEDRRLKIKDKVYDSQSDEYEEEDEDENENVNINENENVTGRITELPRLGTNFISNSTLIHKKNYSIGQVILKVLYINSNFKRFYDLLLYISVIILILISSIEFLFDEFYIFLNLVVDIIFFVDLLISPFWIKSKTHIEWINSMNSSYNYNKKQGNGKKILSFICKSLYNYIFSYFLLDFCSSIPKSIICNQILTTYNKYNPLPKRIYINKFNNNKSRIIFLICIFLKLLKIFKLILFNKDFTFQSSIIHFFRYSFNIHLSNKLISIINYIFITILFIHFLTSLWIFFSFFNSFNWITVLMFNYQNNSYNLTELYIASLYFILTTLFVIGYGDIIGITFYEKLYQSLLMLIGLSVYTFIISNISNIFKTNEDNNISKYFMYDYLENTKIIYGIEYTLYYKIKQYLDNKFTSKIYKNSLVLKDLPTPLQNELTCIIYEDLICSLKFFNPIKYFRNNDFFVTHPEFVVRVLTCLNSLICLRSEHLIHEDQNIEEVIFVKKGSLCLKKGNSRVLKIGQGEHYGDVNIMLNLKSIFSVKVISKKAELLLMDKYELLNLSKDFEQIFHEILYISTYNYEVIKEYCKYINIRKGYSRYSTLISLVSNTNMKLNEKNSIFLDEKDNLSSNKSLENEDEDENEVNLDISNKKIKSISIIQENNELNMIIENSQNSQFENKIKYSPENSILKKNMKKSYKNVSICSYDYNKSKSFQLNTKLIESNYLNLDTKLNARRSNDSEKSKGKRAYSLNKLNSNRKNRISDNLKKSNEYLGKEKRNSNITNSRSKSINRRNLRKKTGQITMDIKKNIQKISQNICDPTSFFKENFEIWMNQNKNKNEIKNSYFSIEDPYNIIINLKMDLLEYLNKK